MNKLRYCAGLLVAAAVVGGSGAYGQTLNGAPRATQDVNLKQVGGTTVVTGGVAGSQGVGGLAPSGAVGLGNPLKLGVVSSGFISNWQAANSVSVGGGDIAGVGIASVFNTTLPTYTNGQYGMLQMGARGSLNVTMFGVNGTSSPNVNNNTADAIGTNTVLDTNSYPYAWNGSSFDRVRTIIGAVAAGTGNTAVDIAPTTASTAATLSQQCTVACASTIVSGVHNLYGFNFSSTATGWLLVYDATSCAANGTVTPVRAYAYPTANVTTTVSWGDIPKAFATGIAACFSTTGPYTATASTTAFIGLDYK